MAISLGTIFGDVRLRLSGLEEDAAKAKGIIADVSGSLASDVKSGADKASNALEGAASDAKAAAEDVESGTHGLFSLIGSRLSDATAGIRSKFSEMTSNIGQTFEDLKAKAAPLTQPIGKAISFIGDTAKEAGAVVSKIAAPIGATFSNLGKAASGLSGGFKAVGGGLATVAKFTGIAALAGVVAIPALTDVIGGLLDKANVAQQAQAQLNAVLTSTHGIAGETAKALDQMGDALASQTTFSKEDISATQSMLLTFTGIHRDVFPATTQAALDMATALHIGPTQAALQLGKALNDPATGMSKLQREGVTFSKSQQEAIKSMVAMGNTAGAQKLMLAELQKEFGGSAAAAGNTFAGGLQKAENAMDESEAKIGNAFIPILGSLMSKAAPLISAFGEWLPGAIDKVTPIISQIASVVGDLVGGLINANQATSPFHDAFVQILAVAIPLGQAIGGILHDAVEAAEQAFHDAQPEIAQLMPALGKLLPIIGGLAAILAGVLVGAIRAAIGAFKGIIEIVTGVANIISSVVSFVVDLITGKWGKLLGDIGNIFGGIWQIIKGTWDAILGAVSGFISGFIGFFQHLFDTLIGHSLIPDLVKGIISFIGQLPGKVLGIISSLVVQFIELIASLEIQALAKVWEIVTGIAGKLASGVSTVLGGLGKIKDGILGFFAGAAGWLVHAGEDLMHGLMQGVKNIPVVGGIVDVGSSIVSGVKGIFGSHSPSTVFAQIGQDLMTGLSQGITAGADGANTAMGDAASSLIDSGSDSLGLGDLSSSDLSDSSGLDSGSSGGDVTNIYVTVEVSADDLGGGEPDAVGQKFGTGLGLGLTGALKQAGY